MKLYHICGLRMTALIINLIHIAQMDTNGILSAVQSHKVHTNAIYAHMDIHETIMFIHIYMSTHIYIHQHVYKYIQTY